MPIKSLVPDLIREGLIDPPLTVSTPYKGKVLVATIESDGTVQFNGKVYPTLSAAAGAARSTVIGHPTYRGQQRPYPQTNGWTFWMYFDYDTGRLEPIDRLRRQYLKATQKADDEQSSENRR